MKHGEKRCSQTPDPVLPTVVLQTRLIAAKLRLFRNRLFEFLMSGRQRRRNRAIAEFRQITTERCLRIGLLNTMIVCRRIIDYMFLTDVQ